MSGFYDYSKFNSPSAPPSDAACSIHWGFVFSITKFCLDQRSSQWAQFCQMLHLESAPQDTPRSLSDLKLLPWSQNLYLIAKTKIRTFLRKSCVKILKIPELTSKFKFNESLKNLKTINYRVWMKKARSNFPLKSGINCCLLCFIIAEESLLRKQRKWFRSRIFWATLVLGIDLSFVKYLL